MTQMIQANIDRPARNAIWQTMVTYTEGQINDDDLWDRLPPKGQEPFIAVMFNVLCSYTWRRLAIHARGRGLSAL